MKRPCQICGTPTQGSRCRQHATHGRSPKRERSWEERKYRATAVANWRTQHGDICPGWDTRPHPAIDLTADHVNPIARGGDPFGPLQVLCRSCNARKGKTLPTS